MTKDTLTLLLDRLQVPILPPKLKAAMWGYRFTLENGQQWDITLSQGRFSLGQSDGPPDCLINCTAEELGAVLAGDHNVLTAFMRGDLRIQGTLVAANAFYTFLRYAHFEEAKA